MRPLRRSISLLCSLLLLSPAALPQEKKPPSGFTSVLGGFHNPYTWREIGPAYFGNSGRIEKLLRAGKLYLSLQDAIALALENNLDIELQRYGPQLAETDLLRAKAGGVLRTSGAAVTTTTTPGGTTTGFQSGAQQVVTGTGVQVASFDPTFQSTLQYSRLSQPQTTSFVTGTTSLLSKRGIGNFAYNQAFTTGTSVLVNFTNTRNDQNALRNDFNPAQSVGLEFQVTQRLWQGWGERLNSRYIRIAKNNLTVSELTFKNQVITTVANLISLYWNLVAANEDVLVKRQALALNQKLYEDNKKQVEIGTLAPIEIIRAEAEVARSQQDLTVSETTLEQQETVLKNALSRSGVASPSLAEARIIPTDKIRIPDVEPVQPIQDLVGRALESRPEIEQSKINLQSARIGLAGTKNALKPSLDGFVDFRNNGLAGSINPNAINPSTDAYFVGGYGTALGQVFRRNFPDYSVGVTLTVPLRNRAAQSDMVRDQLLVRQNEIRMQQQLNQVRVDVQNALISLQQARARYQTAVKSRILQEQTLDAEQKKYSLGASTIFFVIQAQRDLTSAQATEVAALSSYATARNDLERATGQTLTSNGIELDEARRGTVSRPPSQLPNVQ